jgi:hypothetical protein
MNDQNQTDTKELTAAVNRLTATLDLLREPLQLLQVTLAKLPERLRDSAGPESSERSGRRNQHPPTA